jgi:hypothetical protein
MGTCCSMTTGGAEQRMLGVQVTIVRYVSDEPQPGFVECELFDAHGRRWVFVEKVPVVSMEPLDAASACPCVGFIRGEVVGRGRDASGCEIIQIDLRWPDAVESVEGETEFEVLASSLVEW